MYKWYSNDQSRLEETEEKKAEDRADNNPRTPDAHLELEVVIII